MRYSIIIPAFNAEKTIARCIDSIRACSPIKSHELILVDDGSSDSTAKIAKSKKVKVIKLNNNFGPSYARNKGAKAAKGEILVFIDSDVLLEKGTFLRIENEFKENRNIYGVCLGINPKCEMKDIISIYKNIYMHNYCESDKTWLLTMAFAIKRNAFFETKGFNEKNRVCEDMVFGEEMLKRGYKFKFLNTLWINHVHRYTPIEFLLTEIRRSKAYSQIMLTNFFSKSKINSHVLSSMPLSMLAAAILPLAFIMKSLLFFIIMATVFYFLNIKILNLTTKYFGIFSTVKAAPLILFDYYLFMIGLSLGAIDYMRGTK